MSTVPPHAARSGNNRSESDARPTGHNGVDRQQQQATCLLVLGMHRSGTSALTRVLSLLGADLPSNLMPPRPSNEKGFWESTDVQEFNDELLGALGSRWDDVLHLDCSLLAPDIRSTFIKRGVALLERDFSASSTFVIKDPRICKLLPIWQDILAAFGAAIRVVIPFRPCEEVAQSLASRNDFSLERGRMLWLSHLLAAEHDSRELDRMVIDYGQLLVDWRCALSPAVPLMGLELPPEGSEQAAAIDDFLDARLRHHRAPDAPSRGKSPAEQLAQSVTSAFAALSNETATGSRQRRALSSLDTGFQHFLAGQAFLAPVLQDERKEYAQSLHQSVKRVEAGKKDLQQQLEAERQRREEETKHLKELLTTLTQEEATSAGATAQLMTELSTRQADLESLRRRLQETESDREQAEKRLAQAKRDVTNLQDELAETQRQAHAALKARQDEAEKARLEASSLTQALVATRDSAAHTLGQQRTLATRELQLRASIFERFGQSAVRKIPLSPLAQEALVIGTPPVDLLRKPPHFRNVAAWVRLAQQLVRSGLFSSRWFLMRCSQKSCSRHHPVWDWLNGAWKDRVDPNPLFDTRWYLMNHHEVRSHGIDPLVHYLRRGALEKRQPSPYFDLAWYTGCRPELASGRRNPLSHFLQYDLPAGKSPNPWFEPAWYLQQNPDARKGGATALEHFILIGDREGRNPGPGFDALSYWRDNPDVARRRHPPLAHFLAYGAREGRPVTPADPDHDGKCPPESLATPATRSASGDEIEPGKLRVGSASAQALRVTEEAITSAREATRGFSKLFSIIMPTWNRSDALPRAIDSVLAQSYPNWELLICDDGSTDGTAELIASRYSNEIASGRVRYLQLPHAGVSAARNAGLQHAQGQWIAYLDSDNRWHDHYLLMVTEALANQPSARSTYAALHVRMEDIGREFIRARSFCWNALAQKNYIDLNIFAHDRLLFEELGGFDEALTRLVDWDLILRFTQQHAPIFIPYVLADYYIAKSLKNITLTNKLSLNESRIREKHRLRVG